MVDPAKSVFRDFQTDGVPASGKHSPIKAKIREWGTWLEGSVAALSSNVGVITGNVAAVSGTVAALSGNVSALSGDVDELRESQQSGIIGFKTWAALSGVTGTVQGQVGRVTADAGTHTDPVVGGTVPNNGIYRWSTPSAAWERIGGDELAERRVPKFPDDEIVIVQTQSEGTGDINFIYVKGAKGDSNAYIQYRFQSLPIAGIRSDVARLSGVQRALRLGDTSVQSNLEEVFVSASEVELAIKQNGKADYMGGVAHGDEQKYSLAMVVDGRQRTFAGTQKYVCKRVDFIQKSNLLEVGSADPGTVLGTAFKRWQFRADWVEIETTVRWAAAIQIDEAFLAMIPIARVNPSATQVSSMSSRNPEWALENIQNTGFPQVIDQASRYLIWGPAGYSCEIEMLEGWDKPNRRTWVRSDSPTYNKVYFDVTGPGYMTAIGEEMRLRWRFRVNYDG